MKPARTFSLIFGALAPGIAQQLRESKVKSSTANMHQWQKDADAITRLVIRSLIPDSTASAARRKLLKKICANVEAFR